MKHYLLRSSLLPALVCALLVAGLLGATVPTRAAPRQVQTTSSKSATSWIFKVSPTSSLTSFISGNSISGDSISGNSISGDSISGDSISGD